MAETTYERASRVREPHREEPMSSVALELLKLLGAFVGAVIGALGAVSYKEYLDRKRSKEGQQQTRWLPLLSSARNMKEKLEEIIYIYENPNDQWNGYQNNGRPLPSIARDFHELFLLDANAEPIEVFWDMKADPAQRRANAEAVRSVRARIHELNRATVMLYRTAIFLGYAQRVRSELVHGKLEIGREKQEEVTALLGNIRKELNGPAGAGMIDDQQDLIGESVWREDGTVISYYEFRERIFSVTEWEKFTELFRFFVHFHKKLHSEVKRTDEALAVLCEALGTGPEPEMRGGPWTRFHDVCSDGGTWVKRQLAGKARVLRLNAASQANVELRRSETGVL
jgi:hypothetical protein